jgi:HAD superfamily hydrolase (TIGR01509 family)
MRNAEQKAGMHQVFIPRSAFRIPRLTSGSRMTIDAYIFDMDDLLIRSTAIWTKAERTLLAAIGHEWTPELAIQYKGMNALDVAATIHRVCQPALPLPECQKIMRDSLLESFSAKIEAMTGAVELVRAVHGRKPMAVASGSPLEAIRRALSQLGMLECFDQVITSESVARGKPHPDVFLAAARALGVPPERCLVFEDSLIGVKAAIAAGMAVACVPSGPSDEIRRLTPYVLTSLKEVIGEPALMPR